MSGSDAVPSRVTDAPVLTVVGVAEAEAVGARLDTVIETVAVVDPRFASETVRVSVTGPEVLGAVQVVSRADESAKEPPLLEVQA